jgi:hypothetical protein
MKLFKNQIKEFFASTYSRTELENIIKSQLRQKFENVTNLLNESISNQSVEIMNEVKNNTGCAVSGGNVVNISGVRMSDNTTLSIEQDKQVKCKIEATNKFISDTHFKNDRLTAIQNDILNQNDLKAKIEAAQKATALFSNTDINEGGDALVSKVFDTIGDAISQNKDETSIRQIIDTYVDQQVINEINIDNVIKDYFNVKKNSQVSNNCVNYSANYNKINVANSTLSDNARIVIIQKLKEDFLTICVSETVSTLDLLNKLTENTTNYQSNINAADLMATFGQEATSEKTFTRESKSALVAFFNSIWAFAICAVACIVILLLFFMSGGK